MSEKRGGRRAARHAAAAAAAACPNANRSAATGSSAKPRHPTSQFAEGKAPGLGAATHGSGNWGEGLARTKRVVGGEQVAEGVAGHQRGTRGLIQRAGSRHRPEGVFAGLAEPRAPQGPGHPSTHHQEAISSAGSCRMGGWRAKRAGDAAVALVLRPQGRVLLKKVKVKVKVGKSLHRLNFPVLTSSFRPLFDLPDAPSAVPPTSSEWVPGRPVPKPWRF